MSKKRKPSLNFRKKHNFYWAWNPKTTETIQVPITKTLPTGFIKGRYCSEISRVKNRQAHLGKKQSTITKIKRSLSLQKFHERRRLKRKDTKI